MTGRTLKCSFILVNQTPSCISLETRIITIFCRDFSLLKFKLHPFIYYFVFIKIMLMNFDA
jgi:hypothetical protein